MRSAEDFLKAAKNLDRVSQESIIDGERQTISVSKWFIHKCSMCGYQCGYIFFEDGRVVYDSGCNCFHLPYTLNISSWEDVASTYNRVTDPEEIAKMNKYWGFNDGVFMKILKMAGGYIGITLVLILVLIIVLSMFILALPMVIVGALLTLLDKTGVFPRERALHIVRVISREKEGKK